MAITAEIGPSMAIAQHAVDTGVVEQQRLAVTEDEARRVGQAGGAGRCPRALDVPGREVDANDVTAGLLGGLQRAGAGAAGDVGDERSGADAELPSAASAPRAPKPTPAPWCGSAVSIATRVERESDERGGLEPTPPSSPTRSSM